MAGSHQSHSLDRRWSLVLCAGFAALIWNLQIVALYGLASASCFSGSEPETAAGNRGTSGTLIALFVAALVLSLAAGGWSYRYWQISAGPVQAKLQRVHFLARMALLASLGFIVAAVFNGIAIFMLPLCAT